MFIVFFFKINLIILFRTNFLFMQSVDVLASLFLHIFFLADVEYDRHLTDNVGNCFLFPTL
jgi:hypothetical protein